MIAFRLQCDRGDRFEAWFRGNADFDAQSAAGRIECPLCGSAAVTKALMAPAVAVGAREARPPAAADAAPSAEPKQETVRLAAGPDPNLAKAMDLMRSISRHVRKTSDYVGPRFAEEALKIHYDEAPKRSIYGEATPAEVKELAEEGIGFQPIPVLPEERN